MNLRRACLVVALGVTGSVCAEGVGPELPKNVPELLVSASGRRVTTAAEWETVRRPELLKTFLENEYGVRPVERPADLKFEEIRPAEPAFGGIAIRKRIRATYSGPGGEGALEFSVWIPKAKRPVPAFVHCSPRPHETADDPSAPRMVYLLPADYIVSRGYAAIAYDNRWASEDSMTLPDQPTNGVFRAFGPKSMSARGRSEWGVISAWAWGLSRVMDWIETEPLIDAKRVGVVGLSRNGKTALLAGATDTRFALTVSCCSGCCGAKLNHVFCPHSETLAVIQKNFPHWFCPALKDWAGRDTEMPFDQHQFLALLAPRLLYISSASEDPWAGPRGEYAAAELASPAWELYGRRGLISNGFPKPDTPLHAGAIGYHMRLGFHDITKYDWQCYLDFAEAHGWDGKR